MSANGRQTDDRGSSPGNISSEPGLSRVAGLDPVPGGPVVHGADPDLAIPQFDAPPIAQPESRAEKAAAAARSAVRDAADTAKGLRDRVADTAGTARDQARETAHTIRARTSETVDEVRDWAFDRYEAESRRAAALAERGYGKLRQGRTATEDYVAENPLLVGVVGLAAGLLLGALLPRTRQEDRAIGPWADEVKDQGLRYARDMTRRGREFVETALDPDNLDAAARHATRAADDVTAQHHAGPDSSRLRH